MKRSRKKSTRAKQPSRKATARHSSRRWSAEVTKHSDALDLQHDVFKSKDPRKIARSLKHSAEESHRRKGTPYQSAMSMLNFYINRAGKNLPKKQKQILENAKQELRDVFGRS
jgi:putative cell wall-binding protein